MAVASAGTHANNLNSLQADNHTNTPSINFYRPDALPDAQKYVNTHLFLVVFSPALLYNGPRQVEQALRHSQQTDRSVLCQTASLQQSTATV